jgi:hypothetical protein
MQLVILPGGTIRCLYSEDLPLQCLGQLVISRGSHVEPTADGRWAADLAPVGGPQLGPFERRSQALAAEQAWLESDWLLPQACP